MKVTEDSLAVEADKRARVQEARRVSAARAGSLVREKRQQRFEADKASASCHSAVGHANIPRCVPYPSAPWR
jgi:hypothetical protein